MPCNFQWIKLRSSSLSVKPGPRLLAVFEQRSLFPVHRPLFFCRNSQDFRYAFEGEVELVFKEDPLTVDLHDADNSIFVRPDDLDAYLEERDLSAVLQVEDEHGRPLSVRGTVVD